MQLVEFVITAAVLTLAPGPDILFVASQSIVRNRRSGIAVALGLCSGLFVHTAIAALGISILIASSPTIFAIIKYAGIAYLVYLGISSLRSIKASDSQAINGSSFSKLYRTGVTMNLLNPKIIIFFLALFPQFIEKPGDPQILDIMILGVTFVGIALIIFTSIAILADYISTRLNIQTFNPKIIAWIQAIVYWAIAVWLLF